ncbi:hypothetical protein MYAM1_000917 [Malassezia yamatoensis]|uniref:Homeobox domain-containing protein n=1 Tax=Malassezia yamatoensis TaxID=253288 RepID=A0AAJ5YPK0_9BASI|nr:hypothetical protein MYAM1_000917 [Malassezia yamatoensis]
MRFELDFLDGCLSVLHELRAGVSPNALISPALGAPSATLNLRSINVDAFTKAIRERPLASDVQDSLISLFERAIQRLKTTFTQHFSDAQSRWGASRAHILPLLHELFETQCAMAAQQTQESILAVVDERLDAYMAEANSSHWPRPHNAKAIAILETAFQHAPNITQAEKYKLAEATGLQPRQVTIWFQNRRNRRAGSRRPLKRVSGRRSITQPHSPPQLAPVPASRRRNPSCQDVAPQKAEVPPTSHHSSQDHSPHHDSEHHSSASTLHREPLTVSNWKQPTPERSTPRNERLARSETHQQRPELHSTAKRPAALTLDHLLMMDNAKHCLVFSPLDPLPRLDFADLQFDLNMLENTLCTPKPPTPATLYNPHNLSFDELALGQALAAQPLNVADEIMSRSQTEGWSYNDLLTPLRNQPPPESIHELDRIVMHLEGIFHSPMHYRHETRGSEDLSRRCHQSPASKCAENPKPTKSR